MESHISGAMDKCCKCKKSENHVRFTQSASTSAVPSLQDATTSTCGLEELEQIQKSSDEPKVKPSHLTTFYNVDEFMSILFCETEETERLFTFQAKEIIRRDFVLMEQTEKLNELNILMQSAVAAMLNCEENLLYINQAQSWMEHCLSSLLDLYLRDARELPGDERGSFYNNILSANLLRLHTMNALEELNEIYAGLNEFKSIKKLQILEILNCHYQVLCAAQLKIDTVKKFIEEIKEDYKSFFEKHPCLLYCIPNK